MMLRIEMRRMLTMPLGIAAALVFAGPGLAQTYTPPPAPSTAPAEAPKSGGTKPAHLRHMSGEIVSIDASAKTLTVKKAGKTAHEMKLTIAAGAEASLAGLKPGDHVRVGYATEKGQSVAESIAAAPAAHK
jgi:hypothetical protein